MYPLVYLCINTFIFNLISIDFLINLLNKIVNVCIFFLFSFYLCINKKSYSFIYFSFPCILIHVFLLLHAKIVNFIHYLQPQAATENIRPLGLRHGNPIQGNVNRSMWNVFSCPQMAKTGPRVTVLVVLFFFIKLSALLLRI